MADAPKTVIAQVRELMRGKKGLRTSLNRERNGKTDIPLDTFVELLYEEGGSTYRVGKRTGLAPTNLIQRRKWIEQELGIELPRGRPEVWKSQAHQLRINLQLDCAQVLIGSDAHIWPEVYGTAMAGFVDFNRRFKPAVVILNGDGFDGAKVSRHPRMGWEAKPDAWEEIQALSEYLNTVREANPNARYIRTIGNHDARLENYLSANASLIEGVKGTRLSDHILGWEECISVYVNDPECIIKHRGRHSGIHATFNELRRLGTSFVHGHLHAQKLVSYENAHGSIYGVDLGMLAPKGHPSFGYTEDDITDWRSGFGMLTFENAKMEIPELATVKDEERGEIRFRGQTLQYDL